MGIVKGAACRLFEMMRKILRVSVNPIHILLYYLHGMDWNGLWLFILSISDIFKTCG